MKRGILPPNIYTTLGVKTQLYPPPPANCVLYLPGYPPGGSTIYDRSNAFYDTALNTAEELNISETDVDCSASATTIIPVGSVIRIESEQMLVSATDTTLTVSRGYNGTTPAVHATAQDIYRLTTNHGTISGAVWTRLPSGLWVLSFDKIDNKVSIPANASFANLAALTLITWIKPTSIGENNLGRIMGSALLGPVAGWYLSLMATNTFTFGVDYATINLGRDGANNAITLTVPQMVAVTWTGSATATTIKFYVNGAETSYGASANGTGGRVDDATSILYVGNDSTTARTFDGLIGLTRVINAVLTAAQLLSIHQQERHLFGV